MQIAVTKRNFWSVATFILFGGLTVGWIAYGLFGHMLIEAVYKSPQLAVANAVMPSRATTRLVEYFYGVDTRLLRVTVYVVTVWLLLVGVIKEPVGMFLGGLSFLLCSFLLFSTFEIIPSLAKSLHLSTINYYAFKSTYVLDETLVYREKPFRKEIIRNYRIGEPSASLNGAPAPFRTMEWITDADGFRNDVSRKFSDVVLLGDSFLEYGDNASDAFGARLERELDGLTVRNLGKSGYGPFQYLEVFKRYGIAKNPRYAVFCIYAGNDFSDIRHYIDWQGHNSDYTVYTIGYKTFLQRYKFVLQEIAAAVRAIAWLMWDGAAKRILGVQYLYDNLAVVRLGPDRTYKTSFEDLAAMQPTQELLQSAEWETLRTILREFKALSIEHSITPILLYIPASPQIYAEYTTKDSGTGWLAVRDQQIVSKRNSTNAIIELSSESGIALINLVPVYEAAARKGQMVYEPFNSHWNAQGRMIAAQWVAHEIKSIS